jgi:hypothetical protein
VHLALRAKRRGDFGLCHEAQRDERLTELDAALLSIRQRRIELGARDAALRDQHLTERHVVVGGVDGGVHNR